MHLSIHTLTQREWEVLRLLADGAQNKKIAQHLSISTRTVDQHTRSIYEKLAIHNRIQAAQCYFQFKATHKNTRFTRLTEE